MGLFNIYIMNENSHHFFSKPPESFRGKLPFIVVNLVNEIKRRDAMKEVGILRRSGDENEIKNLISLLDEQANVDLNPFATHTVACVFKRYFRMMSENEPLIPFDLFDCIAATIEFAKKYNDEKEVLNALKSVIRMVLKSRYNLLAYVMLFLNEFLEYTDRSQMDAQNIAICFAPNIILPKDSSKMSPTKQTNDTMMAVEATKIMVLHAKELFSDFVIDESLFCTEDDITQIIQPPIDPNYVNIQIKKHEIRKGHFIKYMPSVKISPNPIYNRPSRPVPKREEQPTNIFESVISLANDDSARRYLSRAQESWSPSHIAAPSTFDPNDDNVTAFDTMEL